MRSLVQVQDGPLISKQVSDIGFQEIDSCCLRTDDWNGGIAQLVERLLCKQDVSGSSPLTSTKPKPEMNLALAPSIL